MDRRATRPQVFRRIVEQLGLELRMRVLSKGTLKELSHVIENVVLQHDLEGAVFTGFQESAHWMRELPRYARLAEPRARSVTVFATGNLGRGDDGVVRIRLDETSPLREEWFLVVLTTGFSAVLLGEDTGAPVERESERQFDTVLSLDADVVKVVARFIRDEVATFDLDTAGRIDDALDRYPPDANHDRINDEVLGDIVSALERGRTRLARVAYDEQRAAEELRSLDERKNAFLSAVSHELRTPLTVVYGMATTLQRLGSRVAEERRASMLSALAAQAERLRGLLDDLLDVDRMVRGILVAQVDEVDLTLAIAKAVQGTRAPQQVDVVMPESVMASVDRVQFERIVANLVGNALKYAPAARVIVELQCAEGLVRLSVDDGGPGIPVGRRDEVFAPFNRLDDAHPQPGTGIGLTLVAEFARLQGGRAWIEDAPAGGARVCVELPQRSVA